MTESVAEVGGLRIAYDVLGDPEGEPLLLISGLATQMIAWEEPFCELLDRRGFCVIRFDNRDVGRSSSVEEAYDLDDMATDVAGLLDQLEIAAAHVVGRSLGGMVAQMLAAAHPERVLSLASVMSTTGDREVGRPHPDVMPILFEPVPAEREAYIASYMRLYEMIGSPGHPADPEGLRAMAGRFFERGLNPRGAARQLQATLGMGDRTERLREITAPTVVIHGCEDALIHVSGGEATAAAIPGARLVKIEGMGHDLPREQWPRIVDEIVANAERAS